MKKSKAKIILKGKMIDDDTIDCVSTIIGDEAIAIQLMVTTLVDQLFDEDLKKAGFNIKSLKRIITNEYESRKREKENENSL